MNSQLVNEIIKHDTIILYGLGVYGRRLYFDLKSYTGKMLFALTHAEPGRRFYDREVHSLIDYRDRHQDALVIVAAQESYQNEMREHALRLGFRNVYVPDILLNDYEYLSRLNHADYEAEIAEWYEVYTGRTINMSHPSTFNEKIQWLKLYDNAPIKTRLSDKWDVRGYVRETIGEKYLIPVYGVWDSFDEIDFDTLPERFALKCTHASGTNEIITSKESMDLAHLKKEFDDWMSKNYAYMCGLELNYKDIVPRIFAEEYISTIDGTDLRDYKVHVFDGRAKLIQVDIDRYHDHRRNIYTPDWKYIPVSILYPTAPDVQIERPAQLDELIEVSEKLGKGFIYVRCDFYIDGSRILFGEMTFLHGSGVEPFDPEAFDLEMGKMIHLPTDEEKNE